MKEETKIILADVAERALKTFLQAFLSSISVDVLLGVTDFDAFRKVGLSMLVAALAAGISAAWNGTVKTLTSGGEC
ncbi:MAG: hypothetical protein IJE19_01475 [Clostridia bacterium]|nr:hypothetical protein [Clostridia bacterium]